MTGNATDILENEILLLRPEVLKDHTTNRIMFWATDMYIVKYGEAYSYNNDILVEQTN